MKIVLKKKVLSMRIQSQRKMMYMKAEQFGYTHPEVVAHSQALDVLLNRYQGIVS
ncbi:aspartyl-phosphate phosphatase Spo0E family protein [Sporosarcina sp. NPDC096371]|uniref:aspartyl-phosphate phosphatase Spo0E family protein n=1 Tax=Sporosarcina sp. NPDC096371 TaxID=3364530 RepID=UPI003819CC55